MNIGQKQIQFTALLQNNYEKAEAESITRMVFCEVLQLEPVELRMNKDRELNDSEEKTFGLIIQRLYKNEPVQYVLGVAYFYGLRLLVNENVLIPRRETEELVEWIIRQNKQLRPRILDIGTGSGCIPITLKTELKEADIVAIDIDENALRLAKQNAKEVLNDATGVQFFCKDIFDQTWWGELGKFDYIVSNPPYVTEAEKAKMNANVLEYEPAKALFVPDDDAIKYYTTIADFALKNLDKNGKLFFEINETKGKETIEMLYSKGFEGVELKKDMQGKDRMVMANVS